VKRWKIQKLEVVRLVVYLMILSLLLCPFSGNASAAASALSTSAINYAVSTGNSNVITTNVPTPRPAPMAPVWPVSWTLVKWQKTLTVEITG
jgi:hypothetical protein